MVFAAAASLVAVAGGAGGVQAQECRWVQQTGVTTPSARTWPATTYDTTRHRLIVFGGFGHTGADLGDTWEWDGATWTLVATTGPSPRRRARLSYDPVRARTVLYGGITVNNTFPIDTWEWDGVNWQIRDLGVSQYPGGRTHQLLAFDPVSQKTLMFGGARFGLSLHDTAEWNGSAWTQLSTVAPDQMSHASGIFNPVRGKVMISAWSPFPNYLSRTLEWDGAAWTQVAPASPGSLEDRVFIDTARNLIVCSGYDNDVRDWNGSSWAFRNNDGPPNVTVIGFDELNQRGIAMTQAAAGITNPVWFWYPQAPRVTLKITQVPVQANANPGASAMFAVGVSNAPPVNYQWYKVNTPLEDDGRIVGTHTATLTINNIVESDYAIYNVKVSDACTGILTAGAHLYPVSPPPTGDCYANCDFSTVFPFLNANDFQCFLGVFAAGMSRANCDGSTAGPMLTANDFQCFLNKFSAGCSAP